MAAKRSVEVFSAGCSVCEEAVQLVKRLACSSCDVKVLDMKDIEVAKRAKQLGIRRVPAVVIDGTLAECCSVGGLDEQALKQTGIGKPL
jgi:glutaredoxin 3